MNHQFDRRPRSSGRRGGALANVLVSIALIAIIAAVVVQVLQRARESCCKVTCAPNLSSIYKSMYLYSTVNNGQFPRTRHVPGAPPSFHFDSSDGGRPVNPIVDPPWAGYSNDVVMAVFLIARFEDTPATIFTCPTRADAEVDTFGRASGARALNKASFSKPANLSYSFANMYPDAAAEKAGFRWTEKVSSDLAIAADQNPGVGDGHDVTLPADATAGSSDMKRANSRNHGGAGQNILYGDGHVQWEANPFNGMSHDNIYTVSGSTDGSITTSKVVVGSPRWVGDSVLLPAYK